MTQVSIIIPSRNEIFLTRTVDDLFAKASGDIEVIAVLDGYWQNPILADRPNLTLIHRGRAMGMRAAINGAAAIAKGKYLMKCDAHCLFGFGYDEILAAECDDNWVVIPRRYSLDSDKWDINHDKPPIDYEHIFYPYAHPDDLGLHARPWGSRAEERASILVDEDMSFQGSCWFTKQTHFNRIGGVSEVGYGTFMGEPQEIGFKTQLGPWHGQVMRNKKTWYAHLHKGHLDWKQESDQGGRISQSERTKCNAYSFDFWWNNRWTGRARDIEWLIEHFMPLPGWPADWKERKANGG